MARRTPEEDERGDDARKPGAVRAFRPPPPDGPADAQRTAFAQEAFKVSAVFTAVFEKKSYGAISPRRLQVHEPDSQSTDGGLKARQSIVLAPAPQNTRAKSIVCGWLDSPRRIAELRHFDSVRRQYENRFKKSLDLTQEEYARIVDDVREFARINALEVVLAPAEPASSAARQTVAPARGAPAWMIVAIVILGITVVVLGLIIAARVLR
jgi:hypothetical protein